MKISSLVSVLVVIASTQLVDAGMKPSSNTASQFDASKPSGEKPVPTQAPVVPTANPVTPTVPSNGPQPTQPLPSLTTQTKVPVAVPEKTQPANGVTPVPTKGETVQPTVNPQKPGTTPTPLETPATTPNPIKPTTTPAPTVNQTTPVPVLTPNKTVAPTPVPANQTATPTPIPTTSAPNSQNTPAPIPATKPASTTAAPVAPSTVTPQKGGDSAPSNADSGNEANRPTKKKGCRAKKNNDSTENKQSVAPTTAPTTAPTKTPTTAPSTGVPSTATEWQGQMLTLVNQERAKADLKPLCLCSKLNKAANDHAADMSAKQYFDHTSQDGRTPFDRMKDAGFQGGAMAENIAAGQHDVADVMQSWMNSPGHKANILGKDYNMAGFGHVGGEWVQNFGDSDSEQCMQ